MAITKEEKVDAITIVGDHKHIHVKTAIIIKEDGVELSRSHKRHVVHANISSTDLQNEDSDVQTIANSVHTDEIKTSYENYLKSLSI